MDKITTNHLVVSMLILLVTTTIVGIILAFSGNDFNSNFKNRVAREREYIGYGRECQLIDFGCPEGWEVFNDAVGCGCVEV